jgi:hypothetical protein
MPGPRFDASLSSAERRAANNAIWLCQTCAKLVDNDTARFSVPDLLEWKRQAEAGALAAIGKSTTMTKSTVSSERQIRRNLKMRTRLERSMLRPPEERRLKRSTRPYEKFRTRKIVIRSLDDTSYPQVDESPAGPISGWFVVEPYDFYHGGLEVILSIRLVGVDDEGRWAFVDDGTTVDESRTRVVKAWQLGRIPWRNIREIDERGDGHYGGPHLYCASADGGTPYEEVVAREFGDDYDWPLDSAKQSSSITAA